ncbi:hypothetical protein A5791_05990 [Mycobacterium sp. 852002-51163_SCH5372311]|uniref:hypothetical protein n=1 Tax=Mycobacterium sp. 852002-51163_SCH5372311 TaxID=1834097 RepID=UPI0007FB7BC9|nr:hypothetical protein [Mycobacterium sp. 852002-51163_SCH5372311]OBF81193.1 hypothetical protein A5791_05990 [Mycobacterium sp. 852002-51163_SCH5372311]
MVQGTRARLQRVVNYQISVGALLELAVWLAIPYLCLGAAWTVVHPVQTQQMQRRLEQISPVGADLGAFLLTTALWPASLQIADGCRDR